MKWLFWQGDRQPQCKLEIKRMADQLEQINGQVAALCDSVATDRQQMKELGGQLTKLARMQYKFGQENQVSLQEIRQNLAEERRQQGHALVRAVLSQLDEMDAVYAGLQSEENSAWRPLLKQWTQRLMELLATLGLCEIAVVGKTFDPHTSEAVESVSRVAPGNIPYEVSAVVRRGFVDIEGTVLRKAQVITYKEA